MCHGHHEGDYSGQFSDEKGLFYGLAKALACPKSCLMKKALIIGASGGIGAAVQACLNARGIEVVALSRSTHGLDFAQPDRLAQVLADLQGPFDLVFVATGILTGHTATPEKSLTDLSAQEMQAQFAVNTIGPAMVLREAKRLLPRKGRSVFAALSARVGSIGDNRLGGWYSYRASKAALNQIVHTGAIELARTHREAVCVCLHPGTVATDFTANFKAEHKLTPAQSAQHLLDVLDGLSPEQTGQFFDWKGDRVPW